MTDSPRAARFAAGAGPDPGDMFIAGALHDIGYAVPNTGQSAGSPAVTALEASMLELEEAAQLCRTPLEDQERRLGDHRR